MRPAPESDRRSGFILLELIIVLALIAVIVGLAAVHFANTLPSYKFNETVRNISSTIKQARSLAKIHDTKQVVIIDMDARKYGLEGHKFRDVPEGIYVKVLDPISGEVLNGSYQFAFGATGNLEGGTIVLWSSKRSATIQLDPIVGTVVIK